MSNSGVIMKCFRLLLANFPLNISGKFLHFLTVRLEGNPKFKHCTVTHMRDWFPEGVD